MTLSRSWPVPAAARAAAVSPFMTGRSWRRHAAACSGGSTREALRFSHENPDVQALYRDYLGKPLGEKSHHLLHTDHLAWEMPQAQRGQ